MVESKCVCVCVHVSEASKIDWDVCDIWRVVMFDNHSTNRLQRWATVLLGYDFRIQYQCTENFGQADALSRLISWLDCSLGGRLVMDQTWHQATDCHFDDEPVSAESKVWVGVMFGSCRNTLDPLRSHWHTDDFVSFWDLRSR